MRRRSFVKNTMLSATGLIVVPLLAFSDEKANDFKTADDLETGFLNPPAVAKPQAYWMWMNGHVTKQGITLDLETMKNIGLAGAFIYDTGTGIPKGLVGYGSNEWYEMLIHAMTEARRLGLELLIHNAPGYSSTAGPWVTPEMSMQQLVWSETYVRSDGVIKVSLEQPYTKLNYYKDAFVIAFPTPAGEPLMKDKLERLYLNGNEIDKTILLDKNLDTRINLVAPYILELEFYEAFETRAISITRTVERVKEIYDDVYDHPPTFLLECSDDRITYHTIGTVSMPLVRFMVAPGTQSFMAVKAKYFRLSTNTQTWLSGIELHTLPRLVDWPAKTNLSDQEIRPDLQDVAPEFIIDPLAVIDLAGKMAGDGHLVWNAPPGDWTILRMGHTCTGAKNASSPDSGAGLELDKLSSEAVDFYFEVFLNNVIAKLRSFIPQPFKGILIDSYEVGKQTWTRHFPAAFKQKRNYDIRQWLPAFTGRIMQSVTATEKFLWDVRRTHADLTAANYYHRFKQHCWKQGLEFYNEPYGDGVFDSLQIGQHADVVMAEFWTRYVPGTMGICDQAASIAHAYGKKVVAAEAFTGMPLSSRWTGYPYALKGHGDHIYSRGVNRFAFHVFVHQPYTTGLPGMTMGPYGTHFDRNTTWIKYAKEWIGYLTRTQYLLQQGLYVADICYFKGEDPASGIPDVNHVDPPTPRNLAGDVIGPDVILNRIQIENGTIVLPDGMQYRIMIMAPLHTVSPEVLNKLKALVNQGMTLIVTSRPIDSPGLTGQFKSTTAINKLTTELWKDLDGLHVKERAFGRGKICWNKPLADIMKEKDIKPDFEFTARNRDAVIHYTHRKIQDTDIYFISNHLQRSEAITCHFRSSGKCPEIWNAQTGEIENAVLYEFANDCVSVPVELDAAGSLFIIFRRYATRQPLVAVYQNETEIISTKRYPAAKQVSYQDVTDNFTITLWVKPDTYAFPGKGILIFPCEGESEYGSGHACCGLIAGQNGVNVIERDKGPNRDARVVIACTKALEGWTHIALRYTKGKPSLFINGVMAAEGDGAGKIIHPGLQTLPTDELFSAIFDGNRTEPEVYNKPLGNAAVYELYSKGLPPPELPAAITLRQTPDGMLYATIWENGTYQIKSRQEVKSVKAKGCQIIPVDNAWQVRFPLGSGAPALIQLEKLASWHQHPDFNIRHFSGTASYSTSFHFVEEGLPEEKRILLDLGRVETLAKLILNGKRLTTLWKEPYRFDVTETLISGVNKLEIRVTNLWPNRMIGDAYLPAENSYDADGLITNFPYWYTHNQLKPGPRKTFSAWNTFKKTDPLLASGLLGPVRLITGVKKILL